MVHKRPISEREQGEHDLADPANHQDRQDADEDEGVDAVPCR